MKVEVLYCYPQVESRTYFPLAQRFARSWRVHPPGHPHTLVLGFNGSGPREIDLAPFMGLAYQRAAHNNYGWDVGLYLAQASWRTCDLLVCLGAGTVINHPGWLADLVAAVEEYGPGLYGPFGALYPHPHLRTTVFATEPPILAAYPHPVSSDRHSRYAFEHGPDSLTRFCLDLGFPVVMVTRRGAFPWPDWNDATLPQNGDALLLDKQHA